MTIYDIAEKAGVSIATVSRVINRKKGVGEATRRRVEALLQECGYVPSAIARGMMSKSMRTVAILTVDLRVPHYSRTVYVIERECTRLGYHVTVYNTGKVGDTLTYIEQLKEKQVDGIIMVGSIHNELNAVPDLEKRLFGIPTILVNGQLDAPNCASVQMDDVMGMELVVRHLFEKGHQRMVYFDTLDTDSAHSKRMGYERAMRTTGLTPHVVEIEHSLGGGMDGVRGLLVGEPQYSAVLCGEDITAAGALKGILRSGLRVPHQIAVTGYNNSAYARICEPDLTTVNNKPEAMAKTSIQLLERKLKGEDWPNLTLLKPVLVVGGST